MCEQGLSSSTSQYMVLRPLNVRRIGVVEHPQCSLWQNNCEGSIVLSSLAQLNAAAMLLSDLLRQRETEAHPTLSPFTYKWKKNLLPNRLRNPRAIVRDLDSNLLLAFRERKRYCCRLSSAPRCLASVKQNVVDDPSHLLCINPGHQRNEPLQDDVHIAGRWMRANHIGCVLDNRVQRLVLRMKRAASLREQEERVEQIGHALHRNSHLFQQVFALRLRDRAIAHELRIGVHRREIMPQIMRDRARHSADRGQPLRIDQFCLRPAKLYTHPVKGAAQLSNLFRPGFAQLVLEVPFREGARALHKDFQRTCERPGDRNKHGRADQQC